MKMKRRKKRNRVVGWILLALSLCAMMVSGHRLWDIRQSYRAGDECYAELAGQVRPDRPLPDAPIDFAALQAASPDAVAWLYGPDTAIDYPVMRAKDYDHYLRRLPDGTYNVNGSLFIDYNCAPDFSDQLTVIYGHNMKSGQMFGSLKGYKGQEYYEKHPFFHLYLPGENYRIDLLYGCVIGAGQWRERAFMYEANLDALLAYAARNTTFKSETQYTSGDRVVALSTCSYEFDGARYVVIGVLASV